MDNFDRECMHRELDELERRALALSFAVDLTVAVMLGAAVVFLILGLMTGE